MSVRLFHRNARLVFVVARRGPGDETWWSPHFSPREWGAILAPALELLALPAARAAAGCVTCRLGSMDWTNARYWSTITVRFGAGSSKKRQLVCAALLKAARYRLA
jgi:hypothetical protein